MSQTWAILLSGGSGSRMQAEQPKQFLKLDGKAVILHSLTTLLESGIARPLIVVAHPDYIRQSKQVITDFFVSIDKKEIIKDIKLIAGGTTRHASSLNGFRAIQDQAAKEDIVLVHDAARPIILIEEINRLIDLFQNPACQIASLAAKVTDTLVHYNPQTWQVAGDLNREQVMSIKTPQAIRMQTLGNLIDNYRGDHYTDLLSYGRAASISGYLAEAASSNIKLTQASDMQILQQFLI